MSTPDRCTVGKASTEKSTPSGPPVSDAGPFPPRKPALAVQGHRRRPPKVGLSLGRDGVRCIEVGRSSDTRSDCSRGILSSRLASRNSAAHLCFWAGWRVEAIPRASRTRTLSTKSHPRFPTSNGLVGPACPMAEGVLLACWRGCPARLPGCIGPMRAWYEAPSSRGDQESRLSAQGCCRLGSDDPRFLATLRSVRNERCG